MRGAAIACVILLAASCGDDGGGSADLDAAPRDDAAADAGPIGTLTFTSSIGGVPAPLVWVAAQDGDGEWQTITSDDGIYAIELASSRWGIAYVCEGAVSDTVFVFNGTLDDMTALARSCPTGVSPANGQLSLQLTGLDSNGSAIVGFGNGSALATMASPTVTVSVPAGTWDMPHTIKPDGTDITRFGTATAVLGVGNTVSFQVDASGGTLAVVNQVATAVDPLADTVNVDATFVTANGSLVSLRQPAAPTYATVPAALLHDGDLHVVRATASDDDGTSTRSAFAYFHDGRDASLELPGLMTAQLVITTSAPDVRLSMEFSDLPGTQLYAFEASRSSRTFRWLVTPAWLGQATTHEWEQPEFSGLPGWLDEWYFPDNDNQIVWHHDAIATTGASFPFDYFERPAETPWFNVPGSWDGDAVTVSTATDGDAPL